MVKDFSGGIDLVVSCIICGIRFLFSVLIFFFFGFVRINAHIYEFLILRCVFSWRFLEFGALIGFNFNVFFLLWLGNLSLRNRI